MEQMELEAFLLSLNEDAPPIAISDNVYLSALWYDKKGDWGKAHELIQDLPDKGSTRIHAYLHRKEGDNWNADYWYRRSGTKNPQSNLEHEWKDLVFYFLSKQSLL